MYFIGFGYSLFVWNDSP